MTFIFSSSSSGSSTSYLSSTAAISSTRSSESAARSLGEALVQLHLVGVDAEDLGRELLQLFEIELGCHRSSYS